MLTFDDDNKTLSVKAQVWKCDLGWMVKFGREQYGPLNTEADAIEIAKTLIDAAMKVMLGVVGTSVRAG